MVILVLHNPQLILRRLECQKPKGPPAEMVPPSFRSTSSTSSTTSITLRSCSPTCTALASRSTSSIQRSNWFARRNQCEDHRSPKKIQYVKSPTDISWNQPLEERLEPQLSGELSSKRSIGDLRALRKRVPKLDDKTFKKIRRPMPATTSAPRGSYMDSQWHSVVRCPRTTADDCSLDKRLARYSKVPVLDADSPGQLRGPHSKVAHLCRIGC